MVLIHGMGSWRNIWPRWEIPGYHFYALDLPGFGESDLPAKRQSLWDFARALQEAVHGWSLSEPPLYIAHSFGAMVAVAARHQGCPAAGMILVSPAGLMSPRHAMEPTPFVCVNRILIWITGSRFFGRQMARGLGLTPDEMSPMDQIQLQRGWRRAREMARMGKFYEYEAMGDHLRQSAIPYVVMIGDADPLFPAPEFRTVSRGMPIQWLSRLGHIPMLEAPGQFRERLLVVLQQIYPPRPA